MKAAQKKFERCGEVDEEMRRYFLTVTMPNMPAPTEQELDAINKALTFSKDDSQYRRILGSLKMSPTVHMFAGATETSSSKVWGKGYGDVDKSYSEVFAWTWHTCSYESMEMHRKKHGNVLIRTTDISNTSRSQVVLAEQKTVRAAANRRYETKFTWARTVADTIAVAFEPTTQGGAGLFTQGAVVGGIRGLYLFEKVAHDISRFTIVQSVDLGGSMPPWYVRTLVPTAVSLIRRVQQKFRRTDRVIDKVGGRSFPIP